MCTSSGQVYGTDIIQTSGTVEQALVAVGGRCHLFGCRISDHCSLPSHHQGALKSLPRLHRAHSDMVVSTSGSEQWELYFKDIINRTGIHFQSRVSLQYPTSLSTVMLPVGFLVEDATRHRHRYRYRLRFSVPVRGFLVQLRGAI